MVPTAATTTTRRIKKNHLVIHSKVFFKSILYCVCWYTGSIPHNIHVQYTYVGHQRLSYFIFAKISSRHFPLCKLIFTFSATCSRCVQCGKAVPVVILKKKKKSGQTDRLLKENRMCTEKREIPWREERKCRTYLDWRSNVLYEYSKQVCMHYIHQWSTLEKREREHLYRVPADTYATAYLKPLSKRGKRSRPRKKNVPASPELSLHRRFLVWPHRNLNVILNKCNRCMSRWSKNVNDDYDDCHSIHPSTSHVLLFSLSLTAKVKPCVLSSLETLSTPSTVCVPLYSTDYVQTTECTLRAF